LSEDFEADVDIGDQYGFMPRSQVESPRGSITSQKKELEPENKKENDKKKTKEVFSQAESSRSGKKSQRLPKHHHKKTKLLPKKRKPAKINEILSNSSSHDDVEIAARISLDEL